VPASKGKRNFGVAAQMENSRNFLNTQRRTGVSNVSVGNENLSSPVSNVVLGAMGTVLGGVVLYLLIRRA
jgi:hypothetical protein